VRFDNGAATALELAQQRTSVLNIEAELPALRQQLQQTQHALAVLLGRPPQGFRIAGESLSALQLPAVAAGQPATLLERRPDIRRAEAQLQAANADIGAARAALYPSVRLSAASGVSGFLSGGSTNVTTLAASLAQTIFDGGRLQGQLAQSQARRTELAAQYVQAVLTSFREVEDSLVAVQANEIRAAALTQSAAQAQRAYQLAVARYEAGAHDLLNLLDSQRSRLQAQDSLIQAELARYTATVDLFKALGGGWDSPAAETAAS
jgi:NodT family efflux transporter outer membrane factor (OMF) lipoprotein